MSLCECNCGQDAGVYTTRQGAERAGRRLGDPRRFLRSHHGPIPRDSERWVPNGELRQAVERALSRDDTLSAIAQRMGWATRRNGRVVGETSRLARSIGRIASKDSKGRYTLFAQTTRYETAVKIVRALDLNPVDFNL